MNNKLIGLAIGAVFLTALKLESLHYQHRIEILQSAMNYQVQLVKLQAEKECLEDKVKNQLTIEVKDYNKLKLPKLPSNSNLSNPPF